MNIWNIILLYLNKSLACNSYVDNKMPFQIWSWNRNFTMGGTVALVAEKEHQALERS